MRCFSASVVAPTDGARNSRPHEQRTSFFTAITPFALMLPSLSNSPAVGRPAARRPYDPGPPLNPAAPLAPEGNELDRPARGEYGRRFPICGPLAVVRGGDPRGGGQPPRPPGH